MCSLQNVYHYHHHAIGISCGKSYNLCNYAAGTAKSSATYIDLTSFYVLEVLILFAKPISGLKSTYFQFDESFYEQVEGTAMGSPLSLIVANIFMEDLETWALETST